MGIKQYHIIIAIKIDKIKIQCCDYHYQNRLYKNTIRSISWVTNWITTIQTSKFCGPLWTYIYRIPLPNYKQLKWHARFLTCQFVLVKSNLVEHWEPQNIQHFIQLFQFDVLQQKSFSWKFKIQLEKFLSIVHQIP
jgi:hypothetical protein